MWLVSLSYELDQDTVTGSVFDYTTLYAEYGLTPRLTLGLDAGRGRYTDGVEAVAFLRLAGTGGFIPGQLAMVAGLGQGDLPGRGETGLLRAGLSWGMGWDTRRGAAWVNLDARADYYPDALVADYKLDASFGLAPSERTLITFEIWAEDSAAGGPSARFAPSLHRRIGDRVWLRLGATAGIHENDTVGLVLGTWMEF